MIKKFLKTGIVLTFAAVSLPALAQIGELRNNIAVGVNGGMNFSNVSFTPKIKQKTTNGMTGGLTVRYISEKYFAMICGLQMELNYSQRGWTELIEENTDTYSREMNYLEIPFLAHLAFGKERGGQFSSMPDHKLVSCLMKKKRKVPTSVPSVAPVTNTVRWPITSLITE